MIGTLDTTRREATVVGAGIAGSLAAYALDRGGYQVTLLEKGKRAGGLIQTLKTPYGIAETAAHSLLASTPVRRLCGELGVELVEVRKDSRARYILRDGRLRKFPLNLKEAASALKHAAFSRAENHAEALTLDAWGSRHLGDAALQYLLTPFVRGIYGVQPTALGVRAAFPSLLIPEGKTLLGTMVGKRLKSSQSKSEGGQRMVAPKHGMGELVSRLEEHLERRLGKRFKKDTCLSELPDAPNVVLATPTSAAAELLSADSAELSRRLREVRYTPLVSVTAFVSRYALKKSVRGVGVLIPAREERKSLGILFTSSSFEGRVFDESQHASYTVLLGGSAQPDWVSAPDSVIEQAVEDELETLLGVTGKPLQLVITRWPRAIPQYSTELPKLWHSARETWCAGPGHILFGNYTGQVSLRGMIESAEQICH